MLMDANSRTLSLMLVNAKVREVEWFGHLTESFYFAYGVGWWFQGCSRALSFCPTSSPPPWSFSSLPPVSSIRLQLWAWTTTTASWVFGTKYGPTFSLVWMCCSYAYAELMRLSLDHFAPLKESPILYLIHDSRSCLDPFGGSNNILFSLSYTTRSLWISISIII